MSALYMLAVTVDLFLTVEYFAMFARVILSWFDHGEGGFLTAFSNFTAFLTEPLIMPVRFLLSRFSFVQRCPVDLSFFATYILLVLVQAMLPSPVLYV